LSSEFLLMLGNLAAAVTLRAIADNARIPDGVILIYPATYMHFVPSPSRLLSTIDPMLPTQTLKSCFVAYLPKGEEELVNPVNNVYLSPGMDAKC
jgi:hormone-sensitive lipase